MNHTILHSDTSTSLLDRLLEIRGVTEDRDIFLNPKLSDYRGDPFDLSDMETWTELIIETMKSGGSICIFGDYDVDGITSSYLLYHVIYHEFGYKHIKIMFPDRLKDGYWLKNSHVDQIKKDGHELIITVDNGITSIQEALYAKELWLKLVITDHHKALDELPQADALINPQVSESYHFKEICGAAVAYKLANALLKKSHLSQKQQHRIMDRLLPLVSIATVADVVPLLDENRAIVKRWLDQLTRRKNILPSLESMLDFVNIRGPIKSHHIGFVIGPRINAGGRLATGYDSIKTLLFSGAQQHEALLALDDINTERKKIQKEMYTEAQKQINTEDNILIAYGEDFHPGVVGIVAWKLTEKHNKPSLVLNIDPAAKKASWSLRAPEYFDIMHMLQSIQETSTKNSWSPILKRFWWHKQAWGISIDLDHLDELQLLLQSHCKELVTPASIQKTIKIDTLLLADERTLENLDSIQLLEPFGAANEEPVFVLQWLTLTHKEVVGKNGSWHLKLTADYDWKPIEVLYRSKWSEEDEYTIGEVYDIVGKVKFDDYKKQYYLNGIRTHS